MSEPTGLHLEVYQFLAERFTGAENATPREKIIAQFNCDRHKEINDRVFRRIVSELVNIYNKGICTTSDGGYYVARTGAELDAAARELESKGSACFDRARRLRECDPLEQQERLL